jgi:CHAT domain-containing protein/soluble cytochrome b562
MKRSFAVICLVFALAGANLLPAGVAPEPIADLMHLNDMDVQLRYETLQTQLLNCSSAERPALQKERDRYYAEFDQRRTMNLELTTRLAKHSEFDKVLQQFSSDKKLETISQRFQAILEDEHIVPADLQQYYTAATWLLWNLHDYRQGLKITQVGIAKADEFIQAGKLDIGTPGDCQTFFERCRLLKAKTQALALMDRVSEAKAAADEMMNALAGTLSDPVLSRGWKVPANYGFITLFPLSLGPVVQSAFRQAGEEGAAELIPWVVQGLASQTFMLEKIGDQLEGMGPMMENYKRIGIQVHGEALLLAGQATEALRVYSTYSLDPKLDLKSHPYLVFFLIPKAKALLETGNRQEALTILERLRETARQLSLANFLHCFKWLASFAAGEAHEKVGNPDAAVEAYKEAISFLRDLYENISLAATRREFQKETDKIYGRLIRLLLEKGQFNEALSFLEESHSKTMVDLFEDVLRDPRREWPVELKEKAGKLKRELQQLNQGDSGTPGGGKPELNRSDDARTIAARRTQKLALRAEYERVVHMANQSVSQASGEKRGQQSLMRAKTNLQGKEHRFQALQEQKAFATVIFLVREDPCWVLILGNGTVSAKRLPQNAGKIRSLAARFRNAVITSREDWKKRSGELYEALFQPIEVELAKVSRLAIIPDGLLWYVPFGALADSSGKMLAETRCFGLLSGIPLAADLLTRTSGGDRNATSSLLVLADPDGSLPSAKAEGESLSGLIAGTSGWKTTLFSGKEATESAFKTQTGHDQVSAVHFATHGILDDANPFSSFLMLSPCAEEDGRLEIFEIANEMNLSGLSLAVLSACNTAMGTVSGGNEVICLQQAFHESGVPRVLASLWEVSDEATSRLMQRFYSGLFGGKPVSECLNQAIKALSSEAPAKWSAFQLYGLP